MQGHFAVVVDHGSQILLWLFCLLRIRLQDVRVQGGPHAAGVGLAIDVYFMLEQLTLGSLCLG